VVVRPLRPTKHHRLGNPLHHQQSNTKKANLIARTQTLFFIGIFTLKVTF